jgi:voltage-gated potassium channel
MQLDDYRWRQLWDMVLILSMTYAAIELPVRLVLAYTPSLQLMALDIALTVILCLDLCLQWSQQTDVRYRFGTTPQPRQRFTRTLWLSIDIIAALPLKLFPFATFVALIQLLKLTRVSQRMAQWRHHEVQHANLLRLIFFLYWLLLAAHCLACGWLALDGQTKFSSEAEAPTDGLTHYLRALYWCVTTLATVGYGDLTPTANAQLVYTMVVMFLGVVVYGYVIGNVTSLLANIDLAKRHYRENMERLGAFMRYRNIPLNLQRRLRDYYAYLWENRLGYDESTVLADLPESLRTEVAIFLRRDFIERAPLFRGASHEFVRDLALQLRPTVYTPGDYITRFGEEGQDMYFISRGTVDIVAADGHTVLNTLRDGDFFGEIALLFRQPRTASVRAVDYCDLYVLDKDTFDRVLARYPTFAAHVHEQAERRRPSPITS